MQSLTIANKTMTLKEITDLLEVRHNDAMVIVAKMSEDASFGDVTKISYRTDRGNEYQTYQLNQRQSIAVSARLNTALMMRIIDRWQELESQQPESQEHKIPATFAEALRLAADLNEELEKAQLKIESDKPKVDFALAVRNMQGACSVGDFAKTLGIGRNKFFKQLRDDFILMRNNLPYQKYLDMGCFVVIEQIPFTDSSGKTHPAFTTMVSGKGQVYLEKKFRLEA